MHLALYTLVYIIAVTMLFPSIAWAVRHPFLYTNKLQWLVMHPFRRAMRDPESKSSRRWFLLLMPLILLYRLLIHILLLPVRLLNAIYFNIILFLSVTIRNCLMDLFFPKYSRRSKWRYVYWWIDLFSWRLIRSAWKLAISVIQSVTMTIFDLIWNTLTLFHGTTSQVARKIAHTGVWSAGSGDHFGTGIYFGIEERVARHYSNSSARSRGGDPGVIMARVTLTPCRPAATLPKKLRQAIGSDGDFISNNVNFLWTSLEHWRRDMNWYEFCLTQSGKHEYTRIWRVRPICILNKNNRPERVTWGLVFWPRGFAAWAMLLGTLFILCLIAIACILYIPA